MIRYVPTGLQAPSCGSPLAHFHTKWGFSIKKEKWNLFVEGHRFKFKTTNCMGMFEIDAKKLDLNACISGVSPKHRLKNHFILIGMSTLIFLPKN
jgi:hypothetical protein